jgi:hypothetical protein
VLKGFAGTHGATSESAVGGLKDRLTDAPGRVYLANFGLGVTHGGETKARAILNL